MMQLHQDYNKFLEKDTKIAVIGPENANKFKDYWEENNLKFYGIPDEKNLYLNYMSRRLIYLS